MENSYSTAKHVSPLCGCRIVRAPTQRITAILQDGHLPLLRVRTSGTDKLDLGATGYEKGMRYVIVSADSSDRVASSFDNTITTCQLVRIADSLGKLYVEEVRAPLYFWLAPLCTPAERYGTGYAYSSFSRNSELYENAYAVLAVDQEFFAMTMWSTPDEIKAYLRLAKWTAQTRQNPLCMTNPRILLMVSRGFIDLRTKLNPSTIRSIVTEGSESSPL